MVFFCDNVSLVNIYCSRFRGVLELLYTACSPWHLLFCLVFGWLCFDLFGNQFFGLFVVYLDVVLLYLAHVSFC